jgi:hypothetical protein
MTLHHKFNDGINLMTASQSYRQCCGEIYVIMYKQLGINLEANSFDEGTPQAFVLKAKWKKNSKNHGIYFPNIQVFNPGCFHFC